MDCPRTTTSHELQHVESVAANLDNAMRIADGDPWREYVEIFDRPSSDVDYPRLLELEDQMTPHSASYLRYRAQCRLNSPRTEVVMKLEELEGDGPGSWVYPPT